MNPIDIAFHFADKQLAEALLAPNPPPGIRVSKPLPNELQASAVVNFTFSVYVEINCHAISLAAAVWWIVKQLRAKSNKRSKKNACINNQEVKLEKRDITRLVKKLIAQQYANDAEWRKNHKVKLKKQKKPS